MPAPDDQSLFAAYVNEQYAPFLANNGQPLTDVPTENFTYGTGKNLPNITDAQKQAFDDAAHAFAQKNLTHYLTLVKENYDHGVFAKKYKKEKGYGYDPVALTQLFTEGMHPKSMIRTLMIAELIDARIKALQLINIAYDDKHHRFASDPINFDIATFVDHRNDPGSGYLYDAIRDKTEKIIAYAMLVKNTGVHANPEALQTFLACSETFGALSLPTGEAASQNSLSNRPRTTPAGRSS